MSIFDSLKGLFGQGDAAAMPTLISEALGKTNLGSLQGLVSQLEQGGLGQQVQSWAGSGQNLPVSPDQLKAALGDEHVQQIAQHIGVDPNAVLNLLAEHLPSAVQGTRQTTA
jgi:uncharacterized protein YidB (DUF937 family)